MCFRVGEYWGRRLRTPTFVVDRGCVAGHLERSGRVVAVGFRSLARAYPYHVRSVALQGRFASLEICLYSQAGVVPAARCIVLLALRLDLCQGQYCPQRTLTSWRSPRGGGIPGFDHTGHSSSRGVVVRTYIHSVRKRVRLVAHRIIFGVPHIALLPGPSPATWLNRIMFGFAA